MHLGPAEPADFLSTSNFDLWYFWSLLTYKNLQYLIWKIWFTSGWKMKAKAMARLLTWFMIAQSTLISYHTEAFVKTDVACTVFKICSAYCAYRTNSLIFFSIVFTNEQTKVAVKRAFMVWNCCFKREKDMLNEMDGTHTISLLQLIVLTWTLEKIITWFKMTVLRTLTIF